jgi:hypothetical protein
MAKFYPAPASGGGASDFVVDGYNVRGGEGSSFDETLNSQTAIGAYSRATGNYATAFGQSAGAEAEGSTSVGSGAYSFGFESIAIGRGAYSSGEKAIGIGQGAQAVGQNSIAIGKTASAQGQNSINIGHEFSASDNEIYIGSNNATSLAFPGLGFYTRLALDGQVLCWSSTGGNSGTGGFVWTSAANIGPQDTPFEVIGGTNGENPTFDGDPLFTGSYTKTGQQVHFNIDLDFSNVTSFGTYGTWYLTLPFVSKYSYQFATGYVHDISETRDYPIYGRVDAGNAVMSLMCVDPSVAYTVPFSQGSPITLDSADNLHISGTYIAQ